MRYIVKTYNVLLPCRRSDLILLSDRKQIYRAQELSRRVSYPNPKKFVILI